MRREVAAGAGVHRHVERQRHRERPHRVGLRLLLVGHGQHPLVHAGLDERRRRRSRWSRRPSPAVCTRSSGLPDGAERLGEEQLGHHHALEQVGRLADDDGVDVVERHVGVRERPVDGLAAQAGHRDVLALGAVVGLADADHGGGLLGHQFRPFQGGHRRFCWRAGPRRRVADRLADLAGPDPRGGLADADAAAGEHRVAGERAARGVDRDVVGEAELAAQDQLLVAERRVQLGHLDAGRGRAPAAARGGRGGAGQVAGAHAHRVDVVREPRDPRRAVRAPRAPGRRRRARSRRHRR